MWETIIRWWSMTTTRGMRSNSSWCSTKFTEWVSTTMSRDRSVAVAMASCAPMNTCSPG